LKQKAWHSEQKKTPKSESVSKRTLLRRVMKDKAVAAAAASAAMSAVDAAKKHPANYQHAANVVHAAQRKTKEAYASYQKALEDMKLKARGKGHPAAWTAVRSKGLSHSTGTMKDWLGTSARNMAQKIADKAVRREESMDWLVEDKTEAQMQPRS